MTLEAIERKRAARKADLQAAADVQRAIDVEALDGCEICHGDTSVCHVDVSYTPGLPTMAVARVPKPAELKRYRARIKHRDGQVDVVAANEAAEELAASCLVYPDKEIFAAMCEARPGLKAQLGSRASQLAAGKAAEEEKD